MGLFNTNPILFSEDADVADCMPVDPEDFHDADPVEDADTKGIDAADPIVSEPVAEYYSFMANSEANWNTVMESLGLYEMDYFAKNGTEIMYEAADGRNIIQKFIDLLKKLGSMIAQAFKRMIDALRGKFTQNANFYNKFEDKITKGYAKIPKNNTFVGYNFAACVIGRTYSLDAAMNAGGTKSIMNAFSLGSGIGSDDAYKRDASLKSASSFSKGYEASGKDNTYSSKYSEEGLKKTMNAARGRFVPGVKGEVSAKDYTSSLFKAFHGGDKKVTIKTSSVTIDAIKGIKEDAKAIKSINDQYKTIKSNINDTISQLKAIQSKLEEKADSAKNQAIIADAKALTNADKQLIGMAHGASTQYVAALKDYINQKRHVAMIYVDLANGKNPKELKSVKAESAGLGFLADLSLM